MRSAVELTALEFQLDVRALPFQSHLLTLRLIRKAEHNSTLLSYNDTFTPAETLLFVVEIKVIIASHALTQTNIIRGIKMCLHRSSRGKHNLETLRILNMALLHDLRNSKILNVILFYNLTHSVNLNMVLFYNLET
jgi:hypothetical protein